MIFKYFFDSVSQIKNMNEESGDCGVILIFKILNKIGDENWLISKS
jgi:hypothetical protein